MIRGCGGELGADSCGRSLGQSWREMGMRGKRKIRRAMYSKRAQPTFHLVKGVKERLGKESGDFNVLETQDAMWHHAATDNSASEINTSPGRISEINGTNQIPAFRGSDRRRTSPSSYWNVSHNLKEMDCASSHHGGSRTRELGST